MDKRDISTVIHLVSSFCSEVAAVALLYDSCIIYGRCIPHLDLAAAIGLHLTPWSKTHELRVSADVYAVEQARVCCRYRCMRCSVAAIEGLLELV